MKKMILCVGLTLVMLLSAAPAGAVAMESRGEAGPVQIAFIRVGRYVVVFAPNGGEVEPNGGITAAGQLVEPLPTPTREGYTFDGWFSAPEGGEEITQEHIFNSNTSIYAHWTRIPGYVEPVPEVVTPNVTPDVVPDVVPDVAPEETPDVAPWVNPYPDVAESAWYYEVVADVSQRGLMKGVEGGTFDPEGTVNRAMVMTMLGRLDGADVSGGAANWYDKAVAWAVDRGISDGSEPEGAITREQLIVMIYRLTGGAGQAGDGLSGYVDGEQVSPWAVEAMTWAVEKGLITGTDGGALNPGAETTRAQAAAIFARYCQETGK